MALGYFTLKFSTDDKNVFLKTHFKTILDCGIENETEDSDGYVSIIADETTNDLIDVSFCKGDFDKSKFTTMGDDTKIDPAKAKDHFFMYLSFDWVGSNTKTNIRLLCFFT